MSGEARLLLRILAYFCTLRTGRTRSSLLKGNSVAPNRIKPEKRSDMKCSASIALMACPSIQLSSFFFGLNIKKWQRFFWHDDAADNSNKHHHTDYAYYPASNGSVDTV